MIKPVKEDEQREIEHEGRYLAEIRKAEDAARERSAAQSQQLQRMTGKGAIASGLAQSQLVVE